MNGAQHGGTVDRYVGRVKLLAIANQSTSIGPTLGLIGAVATAVIGAIVTIVVAWRSNVNQRTLAYFAAQTEADATRFEAAASATEAALVANASLISSLQSDNVALRQATRDCEQRISETTQKLREMEESNEAQRRRILKLENALEGGHGS